MPRAGGPQERDWVRWAGRRQDGAAGRGRRGRRRRRGARDPRGDLLAALVDQDADDDQAAPGHGTEGQARRVRRGEWRVGREEAGNGNYLLQVPSLQWKILKCQKDDGSSIKVLGCQLRRA